MCARGVGGKRDRLTLPVPSSTPVLRTVLQTVAHGGDAEEEMLDAERGRAPRHCLFSLMPAPSPASELPSSSSQICLFPLPHVCLPKVSLPARPTPRPIPTPEQCQWEVCREAQGRVGGKAKGARAWRRERRECACGSARGGVCIGRRHELRGLPWEACSLSLPLSPLPRRVAVRCSSPSVS